MVGTSTETRETVDPTATEASRVPALDQLSLESLRAYRQELLTEESTVSYWRRLVQARLDLLLAERMACDSAVDDTDLLTHLREVLTDTSTTQRHPALLRVMIDDEAPLPDLVDLWHAGLSVTADDGSMLRRLSDAERALSTFRKALHRRLDAATNELVLRYSQDPSQCLAALPTRAASRSDRASA